MPANSVNLHIPDDAWICILNRCDARSAAKLAATCSQTYTVSRTQLQQHNLHTHRYFWSMRQLLIDPLFLGRSVWSFGECKSEVLREVAYVDPNVTEDNLYGWTPSNTLSSFPRDYGITDHHCWAAAMKQCSAKDQRKWKSQPRRYGFTALHYAVLAGQVEDVKVLIHRGVDFRTKDMFHRTVFHIIAASGNNEMLSYFLDTFPKSKTFLAAHQQSYVSRLDLYNRLPLHYAVSSGNLAIVQRLLELGGPKSYPTIDNRPRSRPEYVWRQEIESPLWLASRHGHAHLIDFLTSYPSFPGLYHDPRDTLSPLTPLHVAALHGHIPAMEALVRAFPCVADGLGGATGPGSGSLVDVFMSESFPETPLGCYTVVNPFTPLHCAAAEGQLEAVKWLLANGADVNGATDLMMDIVTGEVVKWDTRHTMRSGVIRCFTQQLPSRRTSFPLPITSTCTPLHLACLNAHLNVVSYLLEHGADPHGKRHFSIGGEVEKVGKAIDLAFLNPKKAGKDIVELLQAAGCKVTGRERAGKMKLRDRYLVADECNYVGGHVGVAMPKEWDSLS